MRAFHLASVVKKQIVVRFEGDSDILNAFDRDLVSTFLAAHRRCEYEVP